MQVSASRARILIAVECLCRLHQDWLTGKRWSAYIEEPKQRTHGGEKTNKWKQSEETSENQRWSAYIHTYYKETTKELSRLAFSERKPNTSKVMSDDWFFQSFQYCLHLHFYLKFGM